MKCVRPDYLKLYAVTDESPSLAERVRLAIAGGATCVQHRAKGLSFEAAKADALAVRDVCRAAGVPFAAAGWANDIPQIERFMRDNCDLYFKTVPELWAHLFD